MLGSKLIPVVVFVFSATVVMANVGNGQQSVGELMEELSNWGRWGEEDQLGTLNLITPQKRKEAASLVRKGISVSMARPIMLEKTPDNDSPLEHNMVLLPDETNAWAVDSFTMLFHGLSHSHIDALCHLSHEGKYYNGASIADVNANGCSAVGIDNLGTGILTRGVLMDIPRLKGKPWLEPGEAVYVEDLEAWEKMAGIKVTSGDAVILNTGRWARREAKGAWAGDFSGLHYTTVKWLRERDVAVVGTDAGLDVFPSGIESDGAPTHRLVLVALGMPVLDTMDLTAVSLTANELKQWTFMLSAAPLRIPGGTGSPINAIATF